MGTSKSSNRKRQATNERQLIPCKEEGKQLYHKDQYINGRQRPKNPKKAPGTSLKRKSRFQATVEEQSSSEQLHKGSETMHKQSKSSDHHPMVLHQNKKFKPTSDLVQKKSRSIGEMKEKYECICKRLERDSKVVKTYYGYNPKAPDDIVFHCITKTAEVNENSEFGYEVKYKTIKDLNKEDEYMVGQEEDYRESRRIDGKAVKDVKNINNQIFSVQKTLMKNHSNLLDISPGNCKSIGYSTNHRILKKQCIVFLVKCKGIIPLGEEQLPSTIGKYPTDVREVYFYRKRARKPYTFHQNIQIGCEIGANSGKNEPLSGTIGLFVNYRREGMKGVTCAHVLLDDQELDEVKVYPRKYPLDRVCSQPYTNQGTHNRCGELISVKYTEQLNVALFDIDEPRNPVNGRFPYYDNAKDDIPSNLHLNSCEMLEPEDIKGDQPVYKYGKVTQMTKGRIHRTKVATVIDGERCTNLFEVRARENIFSKEGDSGSLIFTIDENGNTKGVGILIGGNEKRDFAIPLKAALKSFGNCTPKIFETNTGLND